MGRANIAAIAQNENCELIGAIEKEGSEFLGQDAGRLVGISELNIKISDNIIPLLAKADAIIDFSIPKASLKTAKLAAKHKLIHIIGTTGFSQQEEQKIAQAAKEGAIIVKSGNMSLGVNLLASLVKRAALLLDEDFDIEIVEMHHNKKIDAPSGTALLLGEAAASGRNIDLSENAVFAREGIVGARKKGSIGFATLRGGSVIGEHSVIFAGQSERLILSHRAENRSLFAAGALKAALWARDKRAGLYSMQDVLNID